MKLKQLQERRGALVKSCRTILDAASAEKRELTADEATKLTGIEAEIESVDRTIEAEVRQLQREAQNNLPPALTDGENRDIGRFDIGVVLRSLTQDRRLEGVEAEMIAEGMKEARAAGINQTGIMLPRMLVRRENRDMTATGTTSITGDQGGMTIPTETRGLADDFYNASIMRELGATVLEGLVGNLDLPRLVMGTPSGKKAENGSADETTPTTNMLSLSPKRLPSFIDLSEQLLRQSPQAIQTIISAALANQMLATQETAFFHGGGTNEANGIAGTSGIGSYAGGTNGLAPTYAGLIALETLVDTQNAVLGSPRYASNGQIRGKLKTTLMNPSATNSDFILGKDRMIGEYEARFTNAISRTLTKGTSNLASAIFFGNFADYIMAYWGGISLELVRDKTNAISGLYTLVASIYYDGGVLRPKSFAAQLDALGA